MRFCIALAVLVVASPVAAERRPALVPWPAEVVFGPGELAIGPGFRVALRGSADARVERAARRFEVRLARQVGLLPALGGGGPLLEIQVKGPARTALPSLGMDESYTLAVTPEKATLEAPEPWGVLRGMETLLQLVGPGNDGFAIPAVVVRDRPRFPWRGLLIDVGRHFMPLPVIEAQPRRHGGGEVERLPLAPHRGPGLPGREPALPEAARDGLRRALLFAGAGQERHRVRGRPRDPRRPRVRHAGAHHELVRGPSRAGERARPLRDRAEVGSLRSGHGPDPRGGVPLSRRLPRRDGGALPRSVPAHRRRRGQGRPLGGQPAHPGVHEGEGPQGQPRPAGLVQPARVEDRDQPRQADDGMGRSAAPGPSAGTRSSSPGAGRMRWPRRRARASAAS